jgi:hypothetical protein
VLFIINQTAQVVMLAGTISPLLAKVVLYALLGLYTLALLVPLVLLWRLPKSVVPPQAEHTPEYEAFLRCLSTRLAKNPHLMTTGVALDNRAGIEKALTLLDATANAIICSAASSVFVSTAVSQNGRLDALMVLAAQTRLIWRVTHVYNQRPSLQDFIRLYANIAATLFAASELDDLDLREQVEPVIKATIGGSIAGLVPGVTTVASIIVQSVLEGTANAYLTLRVGLIAQTYCRALTSVNRRHARRYASVTAAGMLGGIVSASAANVIKAIIRAAKQAGASTVESAAAGIRGVGAKLNPFKEASR